MNIIDEYDAYDGIRYRKPWMTDNQWWCAQTWARVMGGFHHCGDFKPLEDAIEVSEYASNFSTFDFDRLTRVVFHAHDRAVRIELATSGPRRVKFILHRRRGREGSIAYRHPTVEQALELHRRHHESIEMAP